MFKWIDEAIIDEVNFVDSKHCQLEADVQVFKNSITQRLQQHAKHVDEALVNMRKIIHDQAASIAELKQDSMNDSGLEPLFRETPATNPVLNISAAALALGTLAWLYVN